MGKYFISHLLFVPGVYEVKYFWRRLVCLQCAYTCFHGGFVFP